MTRTARHPNPATTRALMAAAPFLLLLLIAPSARALVAPAYFTGSTTIDRFTQVWQYSVTVPFNYFRDVNRLDIDVDHGVVDDGGLSSSVPPGDWDYDFDIWAPLVGKYDIQTGGVVTYGSPAPNVFAVTWVDLPSRNDASVRNTFQVVFFGDSSYHTNTGFTIGAGSVVFAYGAPGDPHGTVHYSSVNGAAIGMNEHGTVRTLQSLGIGDSQGVLSDLDIPALQNSGDPFLFGSGGAGADPPASFTYVTELGGNTGVGDEGPQRVSLAASPNPVRVATTLVYALAREGPMRLEICDVQGRRVATLADRTESAGPHAVIWNARAGDGGRLAPGVYLARLEAGGERRTREIVVLR
jgi:hypothetical protein